MDRVNRVLKFPKLNASLFQLLLPRLLFPLSSCLKEESNLFSRHEAYPTDKLTSEQDMSRSRNIRWGGEGW